jgi:membrane protein
MSRNKGEDMSDKRPPASPPKDKKQGVWQLGGLSARQVARRVWHEMDVGRDDTFGRAAELGFYFFLAVFPLMIFFLTIFGFMAGHHPALTSGLVNDLSKVVPGSAHALITRTIDRTQHSASGWLVAVGALGALWSGSAGVAALITTLNLAYDVKPRPVWKARAVAIGLTIVLGVLIVAAILISLLGGWVAGQIGTSVGLPGFLKELWRIGEYAVALFLIVLAYAVLYRWGPNRKDLHWAWFTPGAVLGVVMWIAASIGLRLYLSYFSNFSAMYGSLGAVIVLLFWFYILGFSMLAGAEVNAVIESAATKESHPGGLAKGQKAA